MSLVNVTSEAGVAGPWASRPAPRGRGCGEQQAEQPRTSRPTVVRHERTSSSADGSPRIYTRSARRPGNIFHGEYSAARWRGAWRLRRCSWRRRRSMRRRAPTTSRSASAANTATPPAASPTRPSRRSTSRAGCARMVQEAQRRAAAGAWRRHLLELSSGTDRSRRGCRAPTGNRSPPLHIAEFCRRRDNLSLAMSVYAASLGVRRARDCHVRRRLDRRNEAPAPDGRADGADLRSDPDLFRQRDPRAAHPVLHVPPGAAGRRAHAALRRLSA